MKLEESINFALEIIDPEGNLGDKLIELMSEFVKEFSLLFDEINEKQPEDRKKLFEILKKEKLQEKILYITNISIFESIYNKYETNTIDLGNGKIFKIPEIKDLNYLFSNSPLVTFLGIESYELKKLKNPKDNITKIAYVLSIFFNNAYCVNLQRINEDFFKKYPSCYFLKKKNINDKINFIEINNICNEFKIDPTNFFDISEIFFKKILDFSEDFYKLVNYFKKCHSKNSAIKNLNLEEDEK